MSQGYETPALLASAISSGDSNAETVLIERYYRQTLFILERKTGNREKAEDLCQDTFKIMLERLRKAPLDEPEKLAGFLHSIAVNLYIDDIRKAERRKTDTADNAFIEMIKDDRQDQYTTLLQERSRDAIRALLAALPNERDRKLLFSYYIEEKDKSEICSELDLGHRHFDKVIFRAKQRFRDYILNNQQTLSGELMPQPADN